MILNLSQNIFYCMHFNKCNANVYMHVKLFYYLCRLRSNQNCKNNQRSSTGLHCTDCSFVWFRNKTLHIQVCTIQKAYFNSPKNMCLLFKAIFFSTIAMCITFWLTFVENVSLYFSLDLKGKSTVHSAGDQQKLKSKHRSLHDS